MCKASADILMEVEHNSCVIEQSNKEPHTHPHPSLSLSRSFAFTLTLTLPQVRDAAVV